MEDGNIHHLAQGPLDDETFGGFDVFEIDARETRPHMAHGGDDIVGALGVEFDVDAVDIGKAFEQHRFALHHRL